ncbi:MAG: DUF4127 family protein [Spirochaetales bacterium]|nr:DUF4127 family protein [Spirochaetales bacterium]
MRILYLPLDERPCNYRFPELQLPRDAPVTLVRPPRALLGAKRRPAAVEELYTWLAEEVPQADRAILSVEMMLYGGLLPSRIHALTESELEDRLRHFERILVRARRGGAAVTAFGMIMRTPAYSSGEEEPDYYAEYGTELFTRGYLGHKQRAGILSNEERARLAAALNTLPKWVITDYDRRRALNLSALRRVVAYLEEGLIVRLVLPEDDTAPYGYGPEEKQTLLDSVRRRGLGSRVLSYPGADEVGVTTVAAAALGSGGRAPRIHPLFVDERARLIVPKYESRPIGESVSAQIRAVGGEAVERVEHADIVTAVFTSAPPMTDAWLQNGDNCGERETGFLDRVFSSSGATAPPIVIADCAYANGGSTRLVHELEARNVWAAVAAYAGWNTCGNTIGTALAAGVLHWRFGDEKRRLANLVYRIADDWVYQSVVRRELSADNTQVSPVAPDTRIASVARSRIAAMWAATFTAGILPTDPGLTGLRFPWDRLFEVDLDIDLDAPASPTPRSAPQGTARR